MTWGEENGRRVAGALALLVMLGGARAAGAQEPDTVRLGLGEAVRIAAERSVGVQVAEFTTAESRARVTQERASLLPQISGTGVESQRTFNTATFGIDFPSPPGEPPLFDPDGQVAGPVRLLDLRAQLSQTIFDWSAIQRVRGARAAVAESRAREEVAREEAARTAASAYVQAVRAQSQLSARQADVALAEELVQIARSTLAAGTGVRLDVTRAEAQLALVQAQLVAARAAADRGKLALLRAVNLPLDGAVVLTDTLSPVARAPLPSREEALRTAQANRADLRAITEQINAAERQLGAIRAERYPSLSVTADDGWIGKETHLLNSYDWAVEVSVPVFTGLRHEAEAAEQRAAVRALEAQGEDLAAQVGFQVRSALLDLSSAADQVDAARVRLQLAEAEVAEARDRFRAGVAGSADVVTASIRLTDARTAYVDALAAEEAARVQLAVAEGVSGDLR
jgi:outer membrane protein TolC